MKLLKVMALTTLGYGNAARTKICLARILLIYVRWAVLLLWMFFNAASATEVQKREHFFVASINPIYQIIYAITGDKNNIALLVEKPVFEHDYSLTKSELSLFLKADLVFYIADDFEVGLVKFVQDKKFYNLSKISGIKLLPRRDLSKKVDFHFWLSPYNAEKIADFVAKKLCEVDTKECDKYRSNLKKFKGELQNASARIKADLLKSDDVNYVFYHDGYQYFEDYFSLKSVKIISKNHDQDLSVRDLRELDLLVKSKKVKCIFGDVYDEKNSAQKLAKNYQVKFITLDPFGSQSLSYSQMLLNLADAIGGCL